VVDLHKMNIKTFCTTTFIKGNTCSTSRIITFDNFASSMCMCIIAAKILPCPASFILSDCIADAVGGHRAILFFIMDKRFRTFSS
jgi:hypothetical protein